jgi:phage terminase large subunit
VPKRYLDINSAFEPYRDCYKRTQIFFGGASSGKSVFLAQRASLDVINGRNYLVVRNTANTLRTSAFNEVKKVIGEMGALDAFYINKSEMTITHKNNRRQILFKGLDDAEKIKSVTPEKGVITDIWIEEATECREDDIKQLEKRLRGRSVHPKRLTLSFNPILKTHWIFKKYFADFYDNDTLKQTSDLLILKTTYKDNLFLEPEDALALENEKDPYWRDVYTLGNWGVLGDVIFTNWRVDDLSEQKKRFDNIRSGLDFGFGPDPAAFTRLHFDATRNKVYIFDEFNAHEMTNPELAAVLKPRVGRERVICDSAEPKSIKELRLCGLNVAGAEKGPDSVHHGLQWLKQQEIIIDRKCQSVINEFQTYQWKKNRSGETLPVPVDKDNHHLDSVRYSLEDCMAARGPIEFKATGRRRAYANARGRY